MAFPDLEAGDGLFRRVTELDDIVLDLIPDPVPVQHGPHFDHHFPVDIGIPEDPAQPLPVLRASLPEEVPPIQGFFILTDIRTDGFPQLGGAAEQAQLVVPELEEQPHVFTEHLQAGAHRRAAAPQHPSRYQRS